MGIMRIRKRKKEYDVKEMRVVMAVNGYMQREEKEIVRENEKKNFLRRVLEKLQKSKMVLLVWGVFCTMLTVSSAIDPLGGELSRQDRSAPVLTGNPFVKE